MMKILQVCPVYYPVIGGVGIHVQNISERLCKNNDVTVAVTDPTGRLPRQQQLNGVKIIRFKSFAPQESYHFSNELKNYLFKHSVNFDIVHAHSYHAFPALYAAQATSFNRLVFTPHYHGTGHTPFRSFLHFPYKLIGHKIFDKANKIVCVSHYEKVLVKKGFKVAENKLEIIPNGLNLEEFQNEKILEKKPANNRKTILFVGRLENYKGVQYLVEALPKISNDHFLEIVGSGPAKDSILKLVKKKRVEQRVKFYENLPRHELLERYRNADLFVLLSKHEAYGICVAEALASGKPCILANTSALTEWVDDKNCFGIDCPINVNELCGLIEHNIGRSIDGVNLPDWNEVVERLACVYQQN